MQIEPETAAKWIGGATVALVSIAVALRKVVGLWSRSSGDLSEMDAIKTWREEARQQRARADKAYEERNAAIEELGGLRREVMFLRNHVQSLERQVATMELRIEGLRSDRPGV